MVLQIQADVLAAIKCKLLDTMYLIDLNTCYAVQCDRDALEEEYKEAYNYAWASNYTECLTKSLVCSINDFVDLHCVTPEDCTTLVLCRGVFITDEDNPVNCIVTIT